MKQQSVKKQSAGTKETNSRSGKQTANKVDFDIKMEREILKEQLSKANNVGGGAGKSSHNLKRMLKSNSFLWMALLIEKMANGPLTFRAYPNHSKPCKNMEQCRLCSAKLWSNADFAPQNFGAVQTSPGKMTET